MSAESLMAGIDISLPGWNPLGWNPRFMLLENMSFWMGGGRIGNPPAVEALV